MDESGRKKGQTPEDTDPMCHCYNFKLTEAQNIRVEQMP